MSEPDDPPPWPRGWILFGALTMAAVILVLKWFNAI